MLRMTVVTRATAQVGFETSVADRILLRAPARRWDADGAVTRTPRYWNMWWTLTMAAAGLTLLVVVLEALGILKDLGPALGVVGVVVSSAGAVATWNGGPAFGPHWYPLALIALAMPCAWLGGKLHGGK